MPSTPAIDFIVFYVSDLEASLSYFTQKLGFRHDPAQNSPVFRERRRREQRSRYMSFEKSWARRKMLDTRARER